ncbi:MAG: alpha/beta hydrolase [Hyphomicrobiales bacterium]|nr:alpha/beta hydrolase [Hyphomicrobiales bacterium]
MTTAARDGRVFIDVGGIQLETLIAGSGPVVLFLHAGHWLSDEELFLQKLAQKVRVIAPMHPGFGASGAPGDMTTPDDLSYFYLDLFEKLDLQDVTLAGASFGGWVAAEIATKTPQALAGLVLIDALGIRPGAPTDRPICDIFGTSDSVQAGLLYKDPPDGVGDLRAINDDDELRRRLRARDSLAYYGWQPFMHNPRLQGRLHRIKAPSLVLWGDSDGIAGADYGRTYAGAIPGAKFELIAGAGHMAHVEQPDAVTTRIADFAEAVSAAAVPA